MGRALRDALAYFTILPIRTGGAPDAYALSFLPLVGAAIGALAGCFGWFVAWRMPGFGGLAAWIAAIVLTGAIHVDGFLDACDGLFATAAPERRLEIMRDPHHGTFAIAGMAIVALLWVKALDALIPSQLPLAMAFAGTVARLASIANAWGFAYAPSGSMKAAFASRPSVLLAILSAGLAIALGWKLGPATIALVPLAVVAAILFGWWASRRLGGKLTGDVYGAIAVIVEVLVLLQLPALQALLR